MAEKFLNLSGLNTLWSKIKTALNGKTNFRYGRIYITTSYNDVARRYILLAKAEITFHGNWQETSEFILRFYPDNNVKILKFNLRIGGSKTAVYASKYLQHSYLENMTEAQAAAIRVRYTFSEGSCKFWIYLDRSIYAPIYTCVHIQPLSIGSGDRSNKISNGLEQWIFSNGNDSNDALVSAEMEGESELEIESREIHANILSAQTLTETLPISKGGTGATTAKAAEYNLHPNNNTHLTGDLSDDLRIAFLETTPSASSGVLAGYRKVSQIWDYIQSKISSVLGLTKDAYGGTAASATSADSATKATQDGNGNNIVNTYATKTALSDEATARSEADAALQASIESVSSSLTSETTARQNADETLQNNIDAEATTRANADSTLQANIDAESAARAAADVELQESINEKADSSELSSKLNTNASNATIATTNALLNKGSIISDYTELSENDYVITKGTNTNRTTLGALSAWLLNFFHSVTGRFLNLQVYQGEDGALTNVATDYSVSQNYYNMTQTDKLLSKKANSTALNSLGTRVDDIEESLSQAGTRSPGRCLRPTCVFEANASASINTIRQNYNTAIYPYDLCVIINVGSSSITISGFQTSSGTESYSIPAYKCVMFTALGTNSMYVKTTDKT